MDSDENDVLSSITAFNSCKLTMALSTPSITVSIFPLISPGLFSSVLGLFFISSSELYTPASNSFMSPFLMLDSFLFGSMMSMLSSSPFEV